MSSETIVEIEGREDVGPSYWLRMLLVLAVFSAGTWSAGFIKALIARGPEIEVPEEGPENFGVYSEAWHIVESEFYGDLPDSRERENGSIEGLLASLDDLYAAYSLPAARSTRPDQF